MHSVLPKETERTAIIRKCKCGSVWCPSCYKYRKVPQLYARINDRMDWRSTRHIVLTIDRKQFDSPEQCHSHINQKKAIPQLIHNLKRTKGIEIRDYVWILEFYRDGYPHWHLLVDVQKMGKSGQIHFSNIQQYWKFGAVQESYFTSEKHWKSFVGYFGKNGYFAKDKAHQAKLPDWALNSTKKIKRSGSKQIKCTFKTKEEKKREKEREEMRNENARIEKKEMENFYHRQGLTVPEEEKEEKERPTYKAIIRKCGKTTTCVIFQRHYPIMGFSIPINLSEMKKMNPMGRYRSGIGYEIELDSIGFRSFINKFMPKLM